jgi:hypothetical protein
MVHGRIDSRADRDNHIWRPVDHHNRRSDNSAETGSCIRIAKRFESNRRRLLLSFGHHAELASFDPAVAERSKLHGAMNF